MVPIFWACVLASKDGNKIQTNDLMAVESIGGEMKNILILALFLMGVTAYAQPSDKQQSADNPQNSSQQYSSKSELAEKKDMVEQEFGAHLWLRFSENGTPYDIGGDLNRGITATEPKEKVYQLFELHKDVFGILNPREELVDFKAKTFWKNGNVQSAVIYQYYDGIKIYGGHYGIGFDQQGNIRNCGGDLYPEARQVNTVPSISEEQVQEIALNNPHTKRSPSGRIYSTDLLIYVIKGQPHLTWKVCIEYYACYFIDAHTGEMLYEESMIVGPTAPLGWDGYKSVDEENKEGGN
jgi:Zn-dependent metalloprotease